MKNNIALAAQQLKQAIIQFVTFKDYSEQGKSQLKTIQREIVEFGKTSFSINVTLYLLDTQNDEKVLYFSSLLLKNKLKFDFDQLDSSSEMQDFYHKIITIIIKRQSTSAIVINNLSLCLVYYYLHSSQKQKGLLQFFKLSVGNLQNQTYFLKCLQLINQQIDSSKVVIDEQMRELAGNMMVSEQKDVLIELNTFARKYWNENKLYRIPMLECFRNWIDFQYNVEIYCGLHQHYLYQVSFQSLNDPKLCEIACDIITSILNKVRPQENQQLFQSLSKMSDLIINEVQKQIKDGDLEVAQSYIKILCDFGYKSRKQLIQNFNQKIEKFLKDTIGFLKHDLVNCYEIVIDFWIVFIEEMKSFKNLPQKLSELILQIYNVVCARASYSMSYLDKLNSISESELCKKHKDAQDLKQRRDWALQLFDTISQIYGKQAMLTLVCSRLKTLNYNGNQQHFWPSLQVYLFSALPAAKHFGRVTQDLVVLIRSFSQLNPQFIAVRRTYLRFFKALMDIEQKNTQLIQMLFMHIGQMFNEPLLAEKAQRAFEKACSKNPNLVSNNINDFYKLLKQYPGKVNVLNGVLGILNGNEGLMKEYLPQIFEIYTEGIKTATSAKDKQSGFRCLIDILKAISKSKVQWYEDICSQMFKGIWSQVEKILRNPPQIKGDQDDTVQRAARFLKSLMRAIKQRFKQYLDLLFKVVIECFKVFPLCSYLYLLEVSITVYSTQTKLNDYFRQLYETFCQITYSHLNSSDKIQKFVYLIDDYLGMTKRFLIYNAQIILKSSQLPSVFDLCELCSQSQVSRTAKSAYCLYQVMFVFYWSEPMRDQYNKRDDVQEIHFKEEDKKLYEAFQQFLWSRTLSLLQKMIQHLNSVPSNSTRDSILDALIAQAKAFPRENVQLWKQLMPNIPTDIWTKKEKQRFERHIGTIRELNSQKEIRKLFVTMDKRFGNRKYREKLK